MDLVVALKALILGVVEGLTEFLPVSSTGHLIVVGSLLDWNDEKGELFEIVIQFAAILAVCWQYRQRLWKVVATLPRDAKSQRFTVNLVLAFLPAAVLGVIFINTIKKYLFAPVPVASAFIVGGILILWIESRKRTARIDNVDAIKPADAIWILALRRHHHGRAAAQFVTACRHRVLVLPGDTHHIRRHCVLAVQGA
jgi:undecaprenyl-diphosphatase